jgi:putative transposase
MIDRNHGLSLTKQAAALGISRGSVYYLPKPPSEDDLKLMNRIDHLHLDFPITGSRMLRDLLNDEDFDLGRRHVATLMRKMGIEALYRKPRTTKRHPEHNVFPYLIRNLSINRANQVWAMDLTYIPMARGFVYLVAVMDWYSRRVLAHRISITMDTSFCLGALEEAIAKYGKPGIVNTDQGSQFTSLAFIHFLKENKIQISMDGKGAWHDNVFVERLWRTVKYEHVYLHAYDSTSEAKSKIAHYFNFYNRRRPHSRLDRQTPDRVYFESLPSSKAA